MQALEHLRALLSRQDPSHACHWLALQALSHPELAPYVADPLLPYQGEFLSLDSQQRALQHAVEARAAAPQVGMLWGALYHPSKGRASACQIAVATLPAIEKQHWFSLEPVLPVSEDVKRSASQALTEALRLIEQAGLPPPPPARLVFGVEEAQSAVGDSLGLPLFLGILSTLTGLPIQVGWGATGGLGEGVVRPVGWTEAKMAALVEQGRALLTPESVATLAEAAARLLQGGERFTRHAETIVCPLVPEPTFLVADTELLGLHETRKGIVAFEQTVCATLERYGGFLYRRQAGVEEGIRAAFARPEVACQAALALQQALSWRQWPEGVAPLLARIGLSRGAAERVTQGYFGQAPGQAVRLMQAAHAGQILLPQELAVYAPSPPSVLGKHRLRDLSVTLDLCRLDTPEVPACSLPPRTLRVRNHNLPQEPNPLLGREAELTAIRGVLEKGRRLVTLIGPGGVGKTRLALQVAAELADRFPDGVWFVPLAEVRDEDQLITAIAEAMGVAIRDSRVNFVDALADRQALLVLDNCETVLKLAPRIAQLLRQAPGITCLATSQALLSLSGEWRFEIPPLPLQEAEQLFIERALQLGSGFTLTDADTEAIQRICQRLESIPLAVELAAARTRLFSPKEIEERLDDALSLLVTRTRDVPERQRTLRGALEWSFSLLDSADQHRFLRLSLIPGSFTTEAAESVCEEPDGAEWLIELEEKSFVRRESSGRWRILTLLRQFAEEKLNLFPDEKNKAQNGLLRYFYSITSNVKHCIDTHMEVIAFDDMEEDMDIIRFCMDILSDLDGDGFIENFERIDFFLRRRYYRLELLNWCNISIVLCNKNKSLVFGNLMLVKAFCAREVGDIDESNRILDDVSKLCTDLKDEYFTAECYNSKGIILVRKKEYEKALDLYEKSGDIYLRHGDQVRYVRTLNNRAQAKIRLGRFDDAKIDIENAIKIGRDIKCTRDVGVALNTMGFLHDVNNDFVSAKKIMIEYLELCMFTKDTIQFIACINNYFKYVNLELFVDIAVDACVFSEMFYKKMGMIDLSRDVKKTVDYLVCNFGITDVSDLYLKHADADHRYIKNIYDAMKSLGCL